MKVSVVCPTYGREEHGPGLYSIFHAQTYQDRELIVLDDSASPSQFFLDLKDPRVRYHHTSKRTTVGEKRNWLAQESSGELLAHFDDDDYYAPTYLEKMVEMLADSELVKLSAFYLYSITHNTFAYWDLNQIADLHFKLESGKALETISTSVMLSEERELWQLKNLFGYGFSCVYRKNLWKKVPFENVPHGEDFKFFEAAMGSGAKIRLPKDRDGLVLYLRHQYDSSNVYPQYILPIHLMSGIIGSEAIGFINTNISINNDHK